MTQTANITEKRQWYDGFLVHPPLAAFVVHERFLSLFTDCQWRMAKKILKAGMTIGFVVNPEEACDVVADLCFRLKLNLVTKYDEGDTILYVALES